MLLGLTNLNVFHGKFIDEPLIAERTQSTGSRDRAIERLLDASEINSKKLGNDILSKIGKPFRR